MLSDNYRRFHWKYADIPLTSFAGNKAPTLLCYFAFDFPIITHRPAERLRYVDEPWELEGDFTIPCMFTYFGIILDDGNLLMGYSAADKQIGIATVP